MDRSQDAATDLADEYLTTLVLGGDPRKAIKAAAAELADVVRENVDRLDLVDTGALRKSIRATVRRKRRRDA